MKLKALKNLNWSINRIATPFKQGEIFSVSDSIAKEMIDSKSAEKIGKVKAIKNNEENKSVKAEELKTMSESTDVQSEMKRKPGRPKKLDFEPHIPVKGQAKLGL